ncbi:unnamed protein product, partial [Musa acuminata subsp. burmannicoides]
LFKQKVVSTKQQPYGIISTPTASLIYDYTSKNDNHHLSSNPLSKGHTAILLIRKTCNKTKAYSSYPDNYPPP